LPTRAICRTMSGTEEGRWSSLHKQLETSEVAGC